MHEPLLDVYKRRADRASTAVEQRAVGQFHVSKHLSLPSQLFLAAEAMHTDPDPAKLPVSAHSLCTSALPQIVKLCTLHNSSLNPLHPPPPPDLRKVRHPLYVKMDMNSGHSFSPVRTILPDPPFPHTAYSCPESGRRGSHLQVMA